MADDGKVKDEYQEALKKFLAEEAESRKLFEEQQEAKKRRMMASHSDDMKMSKARIEAEIARKKMAIDEEIKKKTAHMWEEYEAKVRELQASTNAEIEQMIKDKTEEMRKKIEAVKAVHAQRTIERRKAIEEDMKKLQTIVANIGPDDQKDRRAFLKKELVDFKKFPETPVLSDETNLEGLGYHINKQGKALLSHSKEYMLYKAKAAPKNTPPQECVVKVVVLRQRSDIYYRNHIHKTSKVMRFLTSGGPNGEPKHPAFCKMLAFFLSSSKTYAFMEECSTTSLLTRAKSKTPQISEQELKTAMEQVLAGLEFMHARAIAHLNLRCEGIIFARNGAAKIGGLGYAEIYFNPDTESFFKLRKVERKREFLPYEMYRNDTYEPSPADVYSFGYLIYAATSDMHKKKREAKIAKFNYDNLPEGPARSFVEETTKREPEQRPKLDELKSKPYFSGSNHSDSSTKAHSPS